MCYANATAWRGRVYSRFSPANVLSLHIGDDEEKRKTGGCDSPDDDHGDSRKITMKSLETAARAAEVGSTGEVVENIQRGSDAAGKGQMSGARRNI
jgi:hypothetical protein